MTLVNTLGIAHGHSPPRGGSHGTTASVQNPRHMGKPIESYFKDARRIPMGEMDPNCFVVEPRQVAALTQNGLSPGSFPHTLPGWHVATWPATALRYFPVGKHTSQPCQGGTPRKTASRRTRAAAGGYPPHTRAAGCHPDTKWSLACVLSRDPTWVTTPVHHNLVCHNPAIALRYSPVGDTHARLVEVELQDRSDKSGSRLPRAPLTPRAPFAHEGCRLPLSPKIDSGIRAEDKYHPRFDTLSRARHNPATATALRYSPVGGQTS